MLAGLSGCPLSDLFVHPPSSLQFVVHSDSAEFVGLVGLVESVGSVELAAVAVSVEAAFEPLVDFDKTEFASSMIYSDSLGIDWKGCIVFAGPALEEPVVGTTSAAL